MDSQRPLTLVNRIRGEGRSGPASRRSAGPRTRRGASRSALTALAALAALGVSSPSAAAQFYPPIPGETVRILFNAQAAYEEGPAPLESVRQRLQAYFIDTEWAATLLPGTLWSMMHAAEARSVDGTMLRAAADMGGVRLTARQYQDVEESLNHALRGFADMPELDLWEGVYLMLDGADMVGRSPIDGGVRVPVRAVQTIDVRRNKGGIHTVKKGVLAGAFFGGGMFVFLKMLCRTGCTGGLNSAFLPAVASGSGFGLLIAATGPGQHWVRAEVPPVTRD